METRQLEPARNYYSPVFALRKALIVDKKGKVIGDVHYEEVQESNPISPRRVRNVKISMW
jgi:hypothetical protein